LQAHRAGCHFRVSHRGLGDPRIVRFNEQCNTSGPGYQLVQKFQPLCRQFTRQPIDPRQIASGAGEACDKTQRDRVFRGGEDNWDCCGRGLGRKCRGSGAGYDHRDLATNQINSDCRQSINLILRRAIFSRYVLALGIPGILQTLTKCLQKIRLGVR
jgi:hypothetical protein